MPGEGGVQQLLLSMVYRVLDACSHLSFLKLVLASLSSDVSHADTLADLLLDLFAPHKGLSALARSSTALVEVLNDLVCLQASANVLDLVAEMCLQQSRTAPQRCLRCLFRAQLHDCCKAKLELAEQLNSSHSPVLQSMQISKLLSGNGLSTTQTVQANRRNPAQKTSIDVRQPGQQSDLVTPSPALFIRAIAVMVALPFLVLRVLALLLMSGHTEKLSKDA